MSQNEFSTNEIPRWRNSSLPFFVVVKDYSDFQSSGARNTPESDLISESPQSTPEPSQRALYPEIRYVFDDDDFVPAVDLLDQQDPDEMSIVVDFDSTGEHVVGAKSFTSNWQITNVNASARSSGPNWSSGQNNDISTAVLTIEGSSSNIRLPQQPSASDLIHILQARNEQLREIWAKPKESGEEKFASH